MFILKALIFNTLNNFTLKNSVHDTEWMQTAATGKEGWETGRVKWTGSPQAMGHTMRSLRSRVFWKTHWCGVWTRPSALTSRTFTRSPALGQAELWPPDAPETQPRARGPQAPAEDMRRGGGSRQGAWKLGSDRQNRLPRGDHSQVSLPPSQHFPKGRCWVSFFLSFLISEYQLLSVKA